MNNGALIVERIDNCVMLSTPMRSPVIAAWALVPGIATPGLTGKLDASDLRPLIASADLSSITRRSAALL